MIPEDASDDDPALLAPNGNHSWPRPRSPIPPHRLAKLANALGISAPVPHSQPSSDLAPSSPLSKPLTPEPRRSPVPSVASTPQLISHSPVPSLHSRFLLHVIPPLHIPHESDSSETFHLTPPPSAASGYHTQFERGTLVPLLPTLQSQLWAIAKEYALPSTAGMILYLVSSAKTPNPDTSVNMPDEPGPRLSEDIWKHLWTRVTKFESESYPRSPNPTTTTGLGFGYLDHHPSPLFPPELPSSPNTLRPLVSSGRITPNSFPPPLTPTGSIASSNPPTRATFSESSQSEVDTPDTSLPSDSRAATLDLPGLTSPSVIPILAKVEFDVDKRKATWYGPWIRSRKLNHQKREQRARTGSDSGTSPITECVSRGDSESDPPKAAPLPLRLVNRQAVPRFLLSAGDEGDDDSHETGYLPLSESPPVLEDPDPDSTVNPLTGGDPDPLSDVFGPDDDAWADIHATKAGQPNREVNPNIVELALDGHALSEPGKTETEDDEMRGNEEEEVRALWESRERPRLALDIPSSPPSVTAEHPLHPPAGTTTLSTYKKAPPPPLTLTPHSLALDASGEPSPLPSSGSIGLAYLREGVSTPSDGDKRTGTVFEELNLGLDFEDTEEFDENDPNDRRRSQYVFRAKLDELEKTLARLSPRELQHEIKPRERSVKSPPWSSSSSLSVNGIPGSANSFAFPSSVTKRAPPEQGDELSNNKSWPAVPYSSLRRQSGKADSSSGPHHLLPPPKLSLNGVPSPMPVSPHKKSFSVPHDTERDESKTRRRDLAKHETMYPEIDPSIRKPTSSNSPIIPLSPDPFGRFSSLYDPLSVAQASTSLGASLPESKSPPERLSSASLHGRKSSLTSHVDAASRPPSSRFSLDSTDEGKNNRTSASLNPVKSIKSLWKKGRKASISFGSGSPPAVQSGSGPIVPHSAPPVPNVSNAPISRSLTATPSSTSRDSTTSLVLPSDRHLSKTTYYDTPSLSTSQLQQAHSSSSINSMVFNQESPYPVHVLPTHPTPRPRTVSQSARITSSASPAEVDFAPPPTPASATDKEKAVGAPRSILKSRRTDSSASPLPPEPQQMIRRSQSRPEIAARLSSFAGSGGRVTTPPPPSALEAARLSRRRSNRAAPPPLPRTPEDEETFKSKDPVPRLESDQRTR